MHSFSLALNHHKRIHCVVVFGDKRHNTPHYTNIHPLCCLVAVCSVLALYGYSTFICRSYTLAFLHLGRLRAAKYVFSHFFLSNGINSCEQGDLYKTSVIRLMACKMAVMSRYPVSRNEQHRHQWYVYGGFTEQHGFTESWTWFT
jgi:hypothetical protein